MTCREHAITFELPPPTAPDQRVVGVVSCGGCDWTAQCTDDTAADVNRFLSTLLVLHVIDAHPHPEAT